MTLGEKEEVTEEVVYDKRKVVKLVNELSMRSFPRAGSVFKIAPQEFFSFFRLSTFQDFWETQEIAVTGD